MGEWFNPVAWNAAVGQLTGGSNPSASAETAILSKDEIAVLCSIFVYFGVAI